MSCYDLEGLSPVLPAPGSFWIAPGCHVIGDVRLGKEASIWFGAVLRGDNEPIVVGERTNVQEGAMLHADPGYPLIIGNDCTIGHHTIVHGCTIGEGSLVGMGATILNGAKIGRSCLIGANALVTEGREYPDRSLIVGSPAKFVRALDDSAVEKLLKSAATYVANWRRFAGKLRPHD